MWLEGKSIEDAFVIGEEEGTQRKKAREEYDEEYVLFLALSGSVTPGEDVWLIDSGASKHMSRQNKLLKT